MSHWTHIHGTLTVSSSEYFTSKEDLEKYVNYALEDISKRSGDITGSEGNAAFFVSAKQYPTCFNSSTGEGYCDAFISIHGNLRDRIMPETEAELKKFLGRLQNYFSLDDILIRIDDDYESKLFMNEELFSNDPKEVIRLPFDYKNAPDEETAPQEEVDAWEDKRDQYWRIQHLNFERYFKKLFPESKVQYCRWVLEHLDLKIMDDILNDVDPIADVAISRDYLERRKERKLPIPKEWEDELLNTQPEE